MGTLGRWVCGFLATWVLIHGAVSAQETQPAPPALHRLYVHPMDPRQHPDYSRRAVKPPSWDTFGGRTHFAVLRAFELEDGRAVRYSEEIDKYVTTHKLGDVLWPAYSLIFAPNLADVVDEIDRRGLYLFDLWGYVPGSGPGGNWQQFRAPDGVFELFESRLGDRWLGMDVGEQDGRYAGGFAPLEYPISYDRFPRYLAFQRHFERMTDDLGNKNATLVSLNFGHYLLREGVYTCIGAETAQGLPNGQVYYSFIRGAGKQYGVPWFGNASVWNRWGWKTYDAEGENHGPTKGTSLSLLKRLIYSHILYNCLFVGFESSWFQGQNLSPVGRIQQAAVEWVDRNGQPGTMVTPIGVLLDTNAGWTFPRHLYSGDAYRVWGNIPYDAGDHFTDGILSMLYPGYQDSSFYHNESGFLTATPYGDGADCLLSDAPLWVLQQYSLLLAGGRLDPGLELREKLEAYARNGGTLAVTAGNIAAWPEGLAGIRTAAKPATVFPAGTAIEGDSRLVEGHPFALHELALPADARVLATCAGLTAAAEVPYGAGRIVVLASDMGVTAEPAVTDAIKPEIDQPLPNPYPMLGHVRSILDRLFRETVLFDAGEGLSTIVCRKSPGEYTVAVGNNGWTPRPLRLVSHCGPIVAADELTLDASEKAAAGYVATGMEGVDLGTSDPQTLAGGDIRIFAIRVQEEGVAELPHAAPPARPQGRLLALRNETSIKEAILARATFFQHFDGVTVDWRYVHERTAEALRKEGAWLKRQGVRLVVDLTSGVNLYPDIRLADNDPVEYAASMTIVDDVLAKSQALGAADVIIALHKVPETNSSREKTWASFETTLRDISAKAQALQITLHLRPKLGIAKLDKIVDLAARVDAPNLRIAPSLALLVHEKADPQATVTQIGQRLGLVLAGSVSLDAGKSPWTAEAPLASTQTPETLAPWLTAFSTTPVVLDAVHPTPDSEYRDIQLLESPTTQE